MVKRKYRYDVRYEEYHMSQWHPHIKVVSAVNKKAAIRQAQRNIRGRILSIKRSSNLGKFEKEFRRIERSMPKHLK